jgi:predicted NAD-dependent protein-ADP-ribosyltransferase YbiA (DUF1768 family)
VIESYLEELRETWDFTTEQIIHIREIMAKYALDASMDTRLIEEAALILEERETND